MITEAEATAGNTDKSEYKSERKRRVSSENGEEASLVENNPARENPRQGRDEMQVGGAPHCGGGATSSSTKHK